MKLRTEIERTPLPRPLDRDKGVLLVGSCFTDHIGQWLQESWLPVMCNPWGVLFNPASIANSLMRVGKSSTSINPFSLHLLSGRYYSFDHHGQWSGTAPEALQTQLQQLDLDVQAFLAQTKHIIVTFGTSWVYEREDKVVANCHKFPASEFTRRRLSVDEIVTIWSQVIEVLPIPAFTFTVSPIRHVKDTLHGNQLSKSTLLLAIDVLQRRYPDRVQYLPVYELLMDDLRDYRFYTDDLVHPSSLAIEAVKGLVMDCAMTPQLRQYMRDAEPIVRALQHRPSDPDSQQYKAFLAETLRRKELLVQSH